MKEELSNPPLVVGLLRAPDPSDDGQRLREQCRENVENGYNFTLLPLSRHAAAPQSAPADLAGFEALPPAAFTRQAHKALSSAQWLHVIGVVSPPPPEAEAGVLERILDEAVQWTRYLGIHALMLPLEFAGTHPHDLVRLGEMLARILAESPLEPFNLWIRTACGDAQWCQWNTVRGCMGVVPGGRLHVALDFGRTGDGRQWNLSYQRWFGESIRTGILPTHCFLTDKSGFPALPENLGSLVEALMRYPQMTWVVEGACLQAKGWRAYRDCLERIQQRHVPTAEEVRFRPSIDQLQRPLQPLYHHLGSISYEEFEQDPVKYACYEKAIRQALHERHARSDSVTLMVLGAGRGPIVDAAVRAARDFPARVRLFAVEKNPSAAVTLRHRARDDWSHMDVTVVHTDMRAWETAERADIIVSELLGSWSDNELSPECLDGAQRLLKPDGISIPESYTSWLAPISSARLHTAVASRVPFDLAGLGARKFLETPYVVKMGAVFALAPEQPCFSFRHPAPQPADNERFAALSFVLPAELSWCLVHGFRGTFDCKLYGEHVISIAEKNFSAGMFSWAPLYIPLENPVLAPGGSTLEVLVWRKADAERVWYEWMVAGRTHVHNSGGRSSYIGKPIKG